jgi:hypothetical protein
MFERDGREAARKAFPQIRGKKILLCVGRIDPVKNQGALIEQLPAILQRHPDAMLVLAGACTDKNYGVQLLQRISKLGLETHVLLTGGLPPGDPRLLGLFQEAAMVLLPSISETFGLVILEAWAAGAAPVSSRTSGARSVIQHGENGFLFDLENPASFHEAVNALLTTKTLAKDFGARGKAHVQAEFDSQVLARRVKPVNLATIPAVRGDARTPEGKPEGFLLGANGKTKDTNPIAANQKLVSYLQAEPGYRIVQHGCHHDTFEFAIDNEEEILRRLNEGTRHLADAGFSPPKTFVAPHDKFSRVAFRKSAEHFPVISTGWFELARLPHAWWPNYLLKRVRKAPHWHAGKTLLLSHPGCLLSRFRPRHQILDQIKTAIAHSPLTVLVTHWWEYFPEGKPDADFIAVLRQTADYLANEPQLQVVAFDDLT